MISSFATYLLLVSVLFAGGAWATEQALTVRRWPRRFLWLATLCASVLFPLGMALNAAPVHTVATIRSTLVAPAQRTFASFLGATPQRHSTLEPANTVMRTGRPVPVQENPAPSPAAPLIAAEQRPLETSPSLPSWDQLVSVLWPLSSIATALWHLIAGLRLASVVRHAPRGSVLGVEVRMTPAGPAVFGLLRPAILWPRWLDGAPATTQAAALAHETQHIAAGDPLLLVVGLLLVVLAPWNPALWWQLQQMRFAMEADCDQRVVRGGTDEKAYVLALLQIAQARITRRAGLAMLMSAPSWLERRVRILLKSPGRRTVLLAAVGLSLVLGIVAALAQLPAPSLRNAELRMLPPEDTSPGAAWARALARRRYPQLFDRHFDGTAVVAAMFNADGTLRLVDEHLFAPGVPPSDLDMQIENRRAGVELLDDVQYASQERGEQTIGPWLDTVNTGRVFVVYEVLSREPDPMRSSARAESALRAYAPELFVPVAPAAPYKATLFMNDDGIVARLASQEPSSDIVARFAALGVPRERLGRSGRFSTGVAMVDYAWPRRPGEPPDTFGPHGFMMRNGQPLVPPAPREDRDDEERIAARYFQDLRLKGQAAITATVHGQTWFRTPWILFGRDGRIWDAGYYGYQERPFRLHSALPAPSTLPAELEYRYPGIRVLFTASGLRIAGVDVATAWIEPNSPIQRRADVDLQHRRDFLVTAVPVVSPVPGPMVAAVDLNGRASMSYPRYSSFEGLQYVPWPEQPSVASRVEVTVTQADRERVTMNVRAQPPSAPHPGSWTPLVRVEARLGQAAMVEFPGDTPDQPTLLLLQVERLKP